MITLQGRAAWRRSDPLAAAVLGLQQRAYLHRRSGWDPENTQAVPAWEGRRVWALAGPPPRVDRFASALARAWNRLATQLGQPQTALLPLARGACWREGLRSRMHPPLVRARAWLDAAALPERFDGAVCFDAAEAAAALPLWFWAERCGAFPSGLAALWTWPNGALHCTLCAHGNLHVEAYGAQALQALDDAAPVAGWHLVQGHCFSGWQATSAIPGRQLNV